LILDFGADAFGISTIVVRATDNSGKTVQDSFDVVVQAVNDAPRTASETYVVKQGATLTTTDATGNTTPNTADNGVLANDSDIDSPSFTARVVRPPANGTLTFNGNGTFTYRPRGLEGTTDSFTYEAVDNSGRASVETTVTFQIDSPIPSTHQNPILAADVNGDGFVSPIDALIIINFLNANGASTPISDLAPPPPFLDTDGSYFITPRDALMVINHLNTFGNGGGGEGEGEGPSADVDAAGLVWQLNACRSSDNQHVTLSEVVTDVPATEALIGPRFIPSSNQGGSMFDDVLDDLGSVIDDLSGPSDEGDEQDLTDLALSSLLKGAN
jgi:Bacterial Ig domain/Dockerin type I domain